MHDHGHTGRKRRLLACSGPDAVVPGQASVGRLRPQTITFARPADVAVRQPDRLSASASSGLPVSFRSDTPGVCSVAGSQVTTLKRGTCTITATQAGNTHYAPAPDQTRSFQVGPVPPQVPRALVIVLAASFLRPRQARLLVRRYRLRIRRPQAERPGRAAPRLTWHGAPARHRDRRHGHGPHRATPGTQYPADWKGPSHERDRIRADTECSGTVHRPGPGLPRGSRPAPAVRPGCREPPRAWKGSRR